MPSIVSILLTVLIFSFFLSNVTQIPRLCFQVSELFGQMKELAPHGGGGSLQQLSSEGNSTPKNAGTPPPGIVIQRTPVSTNRGFLSARQQQQAIESQLALNTATISQSKSYNAGLNK